MITYIDSVRLRELLSYDPGTGKWTWLVDRNWAVKRGSRAGHLNTNGYRQIVVEGRTYLASRLAWFYMTGEWPVSDIDHKDKDHTNDRWANLRQATRSENCANRGRFKSNTSGHKGVSQYQGRWMAYIDFNGERTYLGIFTLKVAAIEAYRKAAAVTHGEFVRLK